MLPVAEPPQWALPDLHSPSGCFETMRAYAGRIFRLPQHLERLQASMVYVHIRLEEPLPQLGRRLVRALEASGCREAVVRVALIPDARRVAAPSIVVQPVQLPTPQQYARGIRVAVVPTKRFPVSQIDPQSKFSCRLGSVMAVMEAQLRGVDEAIFEDLMGYVTESTASNLGVIKDGALLASPRWVGLLGGITWQTLTEAAAGLKMPVREAPLTRHDLYNADEAFLSSTIKEVLAVTMIDGRRIGTGKPGPHTRRLHQAFRALVRKELKLKAGGRRGRR